VFGSQYWEISEIQTMSFNDRRSIADRVMEPANASTAAPYSIAIEDLRAEHPRAAAAYWSKMCGTRTMPAPNDINPAEIPKLLPYLSLIDVLDDVPVDYYYRIEGEALRPIYAYRRMGRRLSEFRAQDAATASHHAKVFEHYEAIRLKKKPGGGRANLAGIGRDFYTLEWICLPLSRDGETVHRILSCVGVVLGPDGNR
jgi:hypothetical protein